MGVTSDQIPLSLNNTDNDMVDITIAISIIITLISIFTTFECGCQLGFWIK